jgi:hypothetical protein
MKTIKAVYSGRSGACCCGCAGKYSYAKATQVEAGIDRGYPVLDEQVSDRSVKIISNKVLNNSDMIDEGTHAYVDNGKRIQIVYFL